MLTQPLSKSKGKRGQRILSFDQPSSLNPKTRREELASARKQQQNLVQNSNSVLVHSTGSFQQMMSGTDFNLTSRVHHHHHHQVQQENSAAAKPPSKKLNSELSRRNRQLEQQLRV